MSTYERIGISWLHDQAFCEYQLVLKYVKATPDIETEATLEGTDNHEALDQAVQAIALAKGTTPITESIPQTVETARLQRRQFFALEFPIACDLMIGRIDELIITNQLVSITDYKRPAPDGKAFRDDIRQTLAYAYCFRQAYPSISLPIHSRIKDETTGNAYWKQLYTAADDKDILDATHRTLDIINEQRVAVPTRNPRKCAGCRYNRFCDKRCDISVLG